MAAFRGVDPRGRKPNVIIDININILLINHYVGSKVHGMEYRPFYLNGPQNR